MKYGLLVTSPVSSCKNIGDYVQSLAAKQFIGDDYCYVDKEEISKFESEEPVKVIMNAWYMWHPENWPPNSCIRPFLTSMHISHLTADEMLANGGKEYLIEHGPVGCRDLDTKKILDDAGVPCYFSGCLTLTLGNTYKYEGKRNGVFFVDPYIPSIRYFVDGKSVYFPKNAIKALGYFMKHPQKICRLVKEHQFFKARFTVLTYYNASMFYEAYSSRFSDEVLFSAEYISHMVPVSEEDNHDTLLKKAESLVRKYAKAQLVVTSRIHCGLPCLGLETPVLFVLNKEMESEKNMFNAPGRFGGLLDLFDTLIYRDDKLEIKDDDQHNGINPNKAKERYVEIKNALIERCIKFLNS